MRLKFIVSEVVDLAALSICLHLSLLQLLPLTLHDVALKLRSRTLNLQTISHTTTAATTGPATALGKP